MKRHSILLAAFTAAFTASAANKPAPIAGRAVEFKTVMHGKATHWEPSKVDVKPGEKVRFVVKHEVAEGFPVHGFSIPALKITQTVERNKPAEIDVDIPTDMKAGSYDVACHLHPAHVGAKLEVGGGGVPAEAAAKKK